MDHRGRFQARGSGLEAPETWNDEAPIQALEGHHLLSGLQAKISPKEAQIRLTSFLKVHDFIDRLSAQGGGGPEIKKSFPVRGQGSRRVDVEVWAGWAFI